MTTLAEHVARTQRHARCVGQLVEMGATVRFVVVTTEDRSEGTLRKVVAAGVSEDEFVQAVDALHAKWGER